MRRVVRLFVALPLLVLAPLAPLAPHGSGVANAQTPPAPAAATAPTPASAAQLQAVVEQVQAFYDRSTSFDADFKQEYAVKQYNVRKQSHGHVVFKKPGKMYWQYDEPVGNRVVSNGSKLKVYEAANSQMYEQ